MHETIKELIDMLETENKSDKKEMKAYEKAKKTLNIDYDKKILDYGTAIIKRDEAIEILKCS